MPDTSLPPIHDNPYNQHINGVYGEFGGGANAQIYYLQSVIKPSELHRITLVNEIPGAEAWSVRDLFQREVDTHRVTLGLIPYFQDSEKAKFFNPLTLTLLPVDQGTNEVLKEIPHIERSEYKDESNLVWECYECPGYYRVRYVAGKPQYALIEWNDSKVKVVAIDGQHRLSALKRYLNDLENTDGYAQFLNWSIPVVAFSVRSLNPESNAATVLDIIRSIFIYINTQARTPNEARQIILSDESVNAIATQELLEYAHENDVSELCDRVDSRIPLMFFDWRGEEYDGRRMPSVTSLKTIEELRDWFDWYILGEDFSTEQESGLGVQPVDALHEAFYEKKLYPKVAREARRVFRDTVLPGVSYLLENFRPYKDYIVALRKLEEHYNKKSDIARHAFYQLRFGTNRASENLQAQIRDILDEIVDEVRDIKAEVPEILQRDIGMRGVIRAFGSLRHEYARCFEESRTWEEYSEWFTTHLNNVYETGWFTLHDAEKRKLLLHITHDHNETVVNYRLDHAYNALGPFIEVLVATHGLKGSGVPGQDIWQEVWDSASDILGNTVLKGYKKEVRAAIRDDYPQGGVALREAVNEKAQRKAEKHVKAIEKVLNEILS